MSMQATGDLTIYQKHAYNAIILELAQVDTIATEQQATKEICEKHELLIQIYSIRD